MAKRSAGKNACAVIREKRSGSPMGWEFAAVWLDDPDLSWRWVWRRIADDSGAVIEESRVFPQLDQCIDDAKLHGFDEDGCGVMS